MVTLNPYLGVSKKPGYKKKQVNEFNRTHMRRYGINLNKRTERALINWLEANKPYQTSIKRLIKEEIAREKLRSKSEKKTQR